MEAAEATWRLRSDFILWYDSLREEVGIHAMFGQLGLSSLGFRGQPVTC